MIALDLDTSQRKLRLPGLRRLSFMLVTITTLGLSACGGGGSNSAAKATPASDAAASVVAATSVSEVISTTPGVSPFINLVQISCSGLAQLAGIEFTIAPQPGSVSKPVDVYYSIANLSGRGDVYTPDDLVTVPVFGLYANYDNQVTIQLHYQDGSSQTLSTSLQTAPYVDPTGIYDHPTIVQARAAGSNLGFDYFAIKSGLASPIIVDTDAQIRWVVPFTTSSQAAAIKGGLESASTTYQDGAFVIGDPEAPIVYRLQLDGTVASNMVDSSIYTQFHHNIDPGNKGLFAEFDTTSNDVKNLESTVGEITADGAVLNQWDLAAILRNYMDSQGDNGSAFVRPGADWFHSNSTTYDPSDDSIIVSSRENFVIKLDYKTGNIIWIFGDPTKYWYTFPSLRAKALTLAPGGLYPIGQHALSIISGGYLMLFNDGLGSASNPAGTSAGQGRTYSAVSAYSIDKASMTAQDVWDFDYGQTLYSPVCSSAYQTSDQSILVDYAVANNETRAHLVGLDPTRSVVFDFAYTTVPCATSWNAIPIGLDNLIIH